VTSLCGVAEQLTPLLRRRSPNSTNDVYVGLVALPNGNGRSKAYVKVFPPSQRNQLVYNEVVGHHLAVQCGLMSPLTFPCACPRELLRAPTLTVMAPTLDPFVLAVASVDANPGALTQRVGPTPMAWADVMNWPEIARVAAFDELMANDDRHISNLVRYGPNRYMLIDNERMLFGQPWFERDLQELKSRRCDPNVLADTIAEGTDEEARRRMMDVARRMMMGTMLQTPDVGPALESACHAPHGVTQSLVDLLNQRRVLLPSLLQWSFRRGDLFMGNTRQ
jgi:hypothetical protein